MVRVILILDDVETQHAGLGHRGLRIGQRGGQEILGPAGPDPRMNMNDQHALILLHHAPLPRQRRPPSCRQASRERAAVGGGTPGAGP